MRSPFLVLSLIASIGLAGCTSSGNLDDLAPRPSAEVTSSIARSDAGDEADATAAEFETEPAFEPAVAVAEDAGGLDPQVIAEPDRAPEPAPQVVAMVAPDKPAAAVVALRAQTIHPRRFRDAKPINFGRASPKRLAVHGVDVSRWQGNINWERLRAQGANFVYIKATDGGDHLDPMFAKNWRGAHGAGLKRGAYHFFYWCRTAGEQADWFIRNVPRVAGALPPVIDVEWNGESSCKRRPSPAKVREKMQVFMDKLERHYGQRPIIYTSPDFYRDNLKNAFTDYPFWLRSVAAHPSKTYPGRKWLFWQYSGSGLSHGVRGRIDLNVFNGSEATWQQWAGGGVEG